MKIRDGFVSNSSSASFVLKIVPAGAAREIGSAASVFDVAKRMVKERDKWNREWDREDGVKRKRSDLLKKIEKAEKDGMDPNTPIMFQSCNYDSYLMRVEDYVVVSTCNNVQWELDESFEVPGDLIPVLRGMAGTRLSDMEERSCWYGDAPDSVKEWIENYVPHLATFWDAEEDRMVRKPIGAW